MAVGDDSLFVEHVDRHSGFWNPLQTSSNIQPSLAAQDDLLTLGIAWWCAPYPCDMYNTSFGSFEKDHPPHLIRPPKERLIFYPVYDLMYWFLECIVHFPYLYFWLLHP